MKLLIVALNKSFLFVSLALVNLLEKNKKKEDEYKFK
jgi:hypothetical protein